MKIQIKRVYEDPAPADGYRVLVDKLWPRGMRKENLYYDLWAKDIAPSAPLRRWYHADTAGHWAEFREKYLSELENSSAVDEFIRQIHGQSSVTLLYASRNAMENHALVLQEFLEKQLV